MAQRFSFLERLLGIFEAKINVGPLWERMGNL
jgi:hypothetical protein